MIVCVMNCPYPRLLGAIPMLWLATACGDDSAACDEAEDVRQEIETTAQQDGLPTAGICTEEGLANVASKAGASRAAEYEAACGKHAELERECEEE